MVFYSVILFAFILFPIDNIACSRVVYQGPEDIVLTARSMDWADEIYSNLWIFPRGMEREGRVGPNSIRWTSKYGSIIASAFDISSSDGLNEKGLSANLLWLSESEYPEYDKEKKGLTVAAWVQYVLDNFATVEEAVNELSKNEFIIVSDYLPGSDRYATVHLAITDRNGDNAVFEYVHGELVISHDRSYNVMTNSPIFERQLAINEYWEEIGGDIMLPGTNRAADRFVRASFYIKAIPQTTDMRIAIASTLSVIRNVSVPYGISTPDKPNISSTRWRSLADHKNLRYYFETTLTPNLFWVDLKDFDLSEEGEVMKLDIISGAIYAGNASGDFVLSEPFEFQGIE